MAQLNTINTTELAKIFHMTNKGITKTLEENGINPDAVIPMPSGRVFKAWPKDKAFQVLSSIKSPLPEVNKPKVNDDIKKELADIKTLLMQILDVLTKP